MCREDKFYLTYGQGAVHIGGAGPGRPTVQLYYGRSLRADLLLLLHVQHVGLWSDAGRSDKRQKALKA